MYTNVTILVVREIVYYDTIPIAATCAYSLFPSSDVYATGVKSILTRNCTGLLFPTFGSRLIYNFAVLLDYLLALSYNEFQRVTYCIRSLILI